MSQVFDNLTYNGITTSSNSKGNYYLEHDYMYLAVMNHGLEIHVCRDQVGMYM